MCVWDSSVDGAIMSETKLGHVSDVDGEVWTSVAVCCTGTESGAMACIIPSGVYVALFESVGCLDDRTEEAAVTSFGSVMCGSADVADVPGECTGPMFV